MGSVLITGMTAPQCSANLVAKSKSFAGVLNDALTAQEVAVDILPPSIEMSEKLISSYDRVLIGISPILSLSSNYSYGALSVLFNTLTYDSSRLVLFIDSPDPAAIRNSLKTVDRSFMSLFKPFYSARKEHSKTYQDRQVLSKIEKAVEYLLYDWSATTVYPSLPFVEERAVENILFDSMERRLVGVNADSMYINKKQVNHANSLSGNRTWCVDNSKSKWFTKLASGLKEEYVEMKPHKMSTDESVDSVMSTCFAAAISPSVSGVPWWTHRYAQAMNNNLPIATEWRYSSAIGNEWSLIPAGIEEMSHDELVDASAAQTESYVKAIGTRQEVIDKVVTSIGLGEHDKASL